MKIFFEQMTFKNILSFGNTATTIEFKNGLNLITGKNGSGKSSALLDTLSFCLYGKPYRKVKIDKLINRKNKKNSSVTVQFVINDSATYEITRGLKPKKLEIKKNGNPLKKMSSTGLNQDEIDKIVGIDYKLFKQIISLSINHNDPFLDLPAAKKREILEQICNINIFSDMLSVFKKDIKDTKIKYDLKYKESSLVLGNIESDTDKLDDIKKTKDNFDKDKQEDIDDIDKKIKLHKDRIVEIKKEGKSLLTERKEVNSDELNNLKESRTQLTDDISQNKYKIQQCQKDMDFLTDNEVCPTCKAPFKDKKEKYTQLKDDQDKAVIENSEKSEQLDEIKNKIKKIEDEIANDREIKIKLKNLKERGTELQQEIKTLEAKKETISERQFSIDITALEDDLKGKKDTYNNLKSELEAIEAKQETNKTCVQLLSDSGIKTYVFNQLIPILNYNINEYLKLFEMPISIEFDKFMEVNIKTLNTFDDDVSYYSFSEGEKKRIDMAILLSFIGVTKSLANWNCNLLVIDELLDSSIDDSGLEKLINSLDNMINDIGTLGVYIISHRMKKEYSSQFKSFIEVVKNANGFSEIKKGK